MRILITGNMGYVGPSAVAHLRSTRPEATLIGLDSGFYAHCLTGGAALPERRLDTQLFADVRNVQAETLDGVDAVVHLAAISNDPIGSAFEEVTLAVNHRATVELARRAKAAGVTSFVFASSCSIYGYAEEGMRNEDSAVDPLTAYARSKVLAEEGLYPLADDGFTVTSLRFGTACGMSDRLRLDLVLNDFVAGAIASKKVGVLSDGTPWRPLIEVRDMARALDWAIEREAGEGGAFLAVNVGSEEWNYQVRDLAEAVARAIPGVELSIPANAPPDRRSYRVDFERFRKLAPSHQPQIDLATAIRGIQRGLETIGFADENFRSSRFVRLHVLNEHRRRGLLTDELEWTSGSNGHVAAV
jgi:nucleoside-diphosphate-sugar epimerase